MRILKIYLVLILLIGVFYGFTYFMDKSTIEDEESLIEKTEHFNQIEKGEIIPMEQWIETLTGQWEVEFTVENPTYILDVSGVTTFRDDSTFTDVLTFKYYEFLVFDDKKNSDSRFRIKYWKSFQRRYFNLYSFDNKTMYSVH